MIAQLILLRELLINFLGNELTLGIILASWILAESLGVYFAGKLVDRTKQAFSFFTVFQIIFALSLPLSIYVTRVFKHFSGIPIGEGIGLSTIVLLSLIVVLLPGFSHGALFSICSAISHSLSRTYTIETIGSIVGGFIFTYWCIPHSSSFLDAFLITAITATASFFFVRHAHRYLRVLFFTIGVCAFAVVATGGSTSLNTLSLKTRWQPYKIFDQRNSAYGNLVSIKNNNEFTLFYNGHPSITIPHPDKTFTEEFGNIPLLFHPNPRHMLLMGAGGGGILHEALTYPDISIDYTELDPAIIEVMKQYPLPLFKKELLDPRVTITTQDGVLFLMNTANRYDIILICFSNSGELSVNRHFTKEFFSCAQKKLHHNGIIALWTPGSATHLSQELQDITASIHNAMQTVFPYTRIIPGDYTILLASPSSDILSVTPGMISTRIEERGKQTDLLIPAYVDHRLGNKQLDWFNQSMRQATKEINTDEKPFAVFTILKLWNKQFSPSIAVFLGYLERINLLFIITLLFFTTLMLFPFMRNKPERILPFNIATSGFFGMMITLLLLFRFQTLFGYVYNQIGLLMSAWMTGIALGSILTTKTNEKKTGILKLFITSEFYIIMSTVLCGWILLQDRNFIQSTIPFYILLILSGFLLGIQLPLAGNILLKTGKKIGGTAGTLYAADLCGGIGAGILGGIYFLPILGILKTLIVIILLKCMGLIFIATIKKERLS